MPRPIAPIQDIETIRAEGWTHQVEWMEGDALQSVRYKSESLAFDKQAELERQGIVASLFDLRPLLA
jgi:hypothetical protein